MTDRTKRMAYRIRLEAILIGMALSNGQKDSERILREFDENEFLHSGQWAFKAIKEQDRQSFADLLAFWGVELQDGERAVDAIIRAAKKANADDRAQTILISMFRSIKHDSTADQIAETMIEAANAIKGQECI